MGTWENDDYEPILLGRLRVHVVNAATGNPVPGVRVAVDDDLPCAQKHG